MTNWRIGWLVASLVSTWALFLVARADWSKSGRPQWAAVLALGALATTFGWMFIADVQSPYALRALIISAVLLPWMLRETLSSLREPRTPTKDDSSE